MGMAKLDKKEKDATERVFDASEKKALELPELEQEDYEIEEYQEIAAKIAVEEEKDQWQNT